MDTQNILGDPGGARKSIDDIQKVDGKKYLFVEKKQALLYII